MTDTAFTRARGTAAELPDAVPSVLCIYCRTDRFVYWPPASRLPSADCPGCRLREPAGRYSTLRGTGDPDRSTSPYGRSPKDRALTWSGQQPALPGRNLNDEKGPVVPGPQGVESGPS